jgi:UDP-GlcNAc:undecaprenyl-phosphate/decaprenyl-phosphate GlcNAc-1-phosphate transferase
MFIPPIIALCAVCAFATVVVASFGKPICAQLGLMDLPDQRKLHENATPLIGGLALACVILPISAASIALEGSIWGSSLLHYVAATFAMALIGMADDRHSLSATGRIVLSMIVFGVISSIDPLFNVRVLSFATPHLEFGLAAGPIAVLFTAVCCVGLVNALNMADGKNGLAISLCIAWLAIVVTRAPAPMVPMFLFLLTGLVALLVFNLRGKLFLGDGGSYGFATAVGLSLVAVYNTPGAHAGRAISAEQIMVLCSVPILDSFRLTFARIRRGQSPMTGDRDHLHHHLQNKFGWPFGLLIYLMIAILPYILLFEINWLSR